MRARVLLQFAFLLPVLAGCAGHRPQALAEAPAPPPPAAPAPPPPLPADPLAGLAIPPQRPDGTFATINTGLGDAEALWHLRTALNVAALQCRDEGEAARVAAYNGFLKRNRTALAVAQRSVAAAAGAGYDDAMTRLYNYWGLPAVKRDFCLAAADTAARIAETTPATLAPTVAEELAALDRPFTAFFRRWADWREARASYQLALAETRPVGQPAAGETRIAIDSSVASMP